MRITLRLGSALLLASCGPLTSWPGSTPEPELAEPVAAKPAEAPRPAVTLPSLPPDTVSSASDTLPPLAAVALRDSLALARQARDSALDARVLDALAVAHPPDSAGEDGDAAAWRAMFDIDVANWREHHRVKYYIDLFTGPVRERMSIWLERMPRYEPTIRAQLIASGLPGDLAYLPLIESGFSSTAVSRSKAVGMWQFIRGTAKLYGLRVDSWVDERRDVPRSTRAAIRFLSDLTAKFGSPYLAAAAYNGGPGRVARGLARMDGYDRAAADEIEDPDGEGPQAGDAAFFLLADTRHISLETKDYVPKLIAAAMIAKQPEKYGFPPIAKVEVNPVDSVVVKEATGLDVIARLAELSLADLWAANLKYLRAVTPPKQTSIVVVPGGRGASTQARLDGLPASERLAGFEHHVKRGETAVRIAARYSVTLAELKNANPVLKKRAPRRGEVVRIPGKARLAGWVSENRRVVSEAVSSGPTHRVRRGETLGHISKRYGVSLARLRAWNGKRIGPKDLIRAGQVLRVRPPARTASTTARRTAG